MNIKKVAAIITVLLLLIPCAVTYGDDAKTVIVFWHSATDTAADRINAYVEEFNQTVGLENGIEVQSVYQGSYNDAVMKMNSMIYGTNTEDLPDVMQLDATGKVSYAACGQRYTLEEALHEHADNHLSAFWSAAMSNWTLEDVRLGAPFACSTTLTFFNKTVLDSLSINAPDTLDDIAAMAEKIHDDDTVIYACVPNTPLLANWLGQAGSFLVNQCNGSEGTATELDCLENGALKAFLEKWIILYDSGALANANSSTDAFSAGKQLLMTSSSSNIASVLGKINGSFELGLCYFPRFDQDSLYGASVSGSCLVMFDHGDRRKEAAWIFVQYMTDPQVQADFAIHTGYIPACREAVSTTVWEQFIQSNPLYGIALRQLTETDASMKSVTVGPSADFYYTIMNDISEMLDSSMSVDDTLEILSDDLNGLLADYARANP